MCTYYIFIESDITCEDCRTLSVSLSLAMQDRSWFPCVLLRFLTSSLLCILVGSSRLWVNSEVNKMTVFNLVIVEND